MPINYTKIIILIVIIGGFIAGLFLLNKSCSSGEVYDNKLGCIKDCSTLPNMRYNTEKKDCVKNCLENEKDCGGVCYSSDRNEQCLNNYVCQLNQTLCGTSCMNNDQSCIAGVIYDSSQVCDDNPDKPVICDNILTQCDKVKKVCVPCAKGRVLCSDGIKDAVCCPENNFCTTDGTCTACDPNTRTVCGKSCCLTGQELCKSDNSGCLTCTTSLCKDKCLGDGQICTDSGPCDPKNVYEQGGIKYCCSKVACNGKCCGPNQSCQGDKCMDICGSEFCDPDKQSCFDSYCINKGCEWAETVYDPQSIKYGTSGQQLEICRLEGTPPTYWAKKHQNISRTAKNVQASQIDCNSNDCRRRVAEKGLNTAQFDSTTKTCNAFFNCDQFLPDAFTSCPLDNKKSCCVDASGFTGQVCLDGKSCYGIGICSNCLDDDMYCGGHGKCSITVADKCDCVDGYDPAFNCSKCLPGRTYRNIFCQTGSVGKFNCDRGGNVIFDIAVLTTDNRNYLTADPNGRLIGYTDAIKLFTKIIFRIDNLHFANNFSLLENNFQNINDRLADTVETDLVIDITDFIKWCDRYGGVYLTIFWGGYVPNQSNTVSVFLIS
jgi:hypothetical protein